MADRYINYDKLLEARHRLGLDEMSMIHKVNAFNQFIDHFPTADVTEVIRCKDCKFYRKYLCIRAHGPAAVVSNDFCSRGVRKEKSDNKDI